MYPILCHYFYKGKLPFNYGTEDHAKQLWSELPHWRFINYTSAVAKKNRWWAHQQRDREATPELPLLLLALIGVNITKGKFRSMVDDLPGFGGGLAFADQTEACSLEQDSSEAAPRSCAAGSSNGPPPPPRDDSRREVATSSQDLAAMRLQTPDNARLVMRILANFANLRLNVVSWWCSWPLEEDHRFTVTKLSTRSGCREYHIAHACQDYDAVLEKVRRLMARGKFHVQASPFQTYDRVWA